MATLVGEAMAACGVVITSSQCFIMILSPSISVLASFA
jgi:hypothetical protein